MSGEWAPGEVAQKWPVPGGVWLTVRPVEEVALRLEELLSIFRVATDLLVFIAAGLIALVMGLVAGITVSLAIVLFG